MLAASGKLNLSGGGPSVIVPIEKELVDALYKPSQWAVTPDPAEHNRRSVYLIAKRNLRLPFMEVFDAPDMLVSCPRRESSTHAPQALELLNGTMVQPAGCGAGGASGNRSGIRYAASKSTWLIGWWRAVRPTPHETAAGSDVSRSGRQASSIRAWRCST